MHKFFTFICISLLCSQSIFSLNYTIKELDRTNLEQIEQIRQLFKNSSIQSKLQPNPQDIEKWITQNKRHFLIAVNKKGIVGGVAIYYISAHQQLWLETMVIASAHLHKSIATNLLKQLEEIPGKTKIGTTVTKKNIAFHQLFKKLGYEQTGQFLNMSKSTKKESLFKTNMSNFKIQPLDYNNLAEIEQFAKLFDVNEVNVAWSTEEMQDFTTYSNYKFLAAFDHNNQLCGGLIYHIRQTDWEIYTLAVQKNSRHSGVATKIIQYLEQLALDNGIQKLTLSVLPTNYAAISCYQKSGFIKEETIYKMVKIMQS